MANESHRRANEKLNRRQELIDAAAQIFHEKGFDGTTIQDIADVLGILKGSLYHYIDSKDDLLYEVVQECHSAGLAHIEACRALEADAMTTLRFFIRGHIELIQNEHVKIGVFLRDYRALRQDRREQVIRDRSTYSSYVEELIRRGQEEGDIAAGHDPELATLALLGMSNWMYEWWRPDTRFDPETVVTVFTQLALGALASSAPDLTMS